MPDYSDESPVDDSDIAYRRVPNVAQNSFMVVDEGTQVRRPTSANFRSDTDGLSVYLNSVLRDCGLDESALVREPNNGILELRVGEVRGLRLEKAPEFALDVIRDAFPADTDEIHDRDAAHALMVGQEALTKSQRKDVQRRLVDICRVIRDPGAE